MPLSTPTVGGAQEVIDALESIGTYNDLALHQEIVAGKYQAISD